MVVTIVEDFKRQTSEYDRLRLAVVALMNQLSNDVGVNLLRIESRLKDPESLEEKLRRPDKVGKYKKVSDVTDLCGVRLIAFDNNDCNKLVDAIRLNFEIDEKNSVDKSRIKEDDRFGCASTHLIVALSGSRSELFEYKDIVGLWVEVQIRTVLQHAWAVLDWSLRYKSEVEIPKEIRRKLFRVSALLEAADEAFLELKSVSSLLRQKYEEEVESNELKSLINRDSLEEFIRNSSVIKTVFSKCQELGILVYLDSLHVEPAWSYLIKSLFIMDIKTLKQFSDVLESLGDESFAEVKKIINEVGGQYGPFTLLRNLALTKATKAARMRVLTEAPTAERFDKIERKILLE